MKRFPWIAVVVLATGLLNLGALRNGFYWDDRALILEGKLIRSWDSLPEIFRHEMWFNVDLGARAPEAAVDTYRPVSTVSFLVDFKLWGLEAAGYHLTNLLIHLASVLLLFLVLKSVATAGIAIQAASLFAFHPITSECIHYASARTDSLPLLFGLAGFWAVLRLPAWNPLAPVLFLLSALSKETGILFAVIWFFFATRVPSPFEPAARRNLRWLLPVATIAVYAVLRKSALGSSKALMDLQHLTELFLNYPRFLAKSLMLVLTPLPQFPMQVFPVVRSGDAGLFAWGSAFAFTLVAAGLAAFGLRRRRPWGLLPLWILLATVLPFVAVSLTQEWSPRYFYCALPALSVCITLLLRSLHTVPALRWAVFGSLTASFALASFSASNGYASEEVFYRRILQRNPAASVARYNLANTLARSQRWGEAVPIYERLCTDQPGDPRFWNNLGVAFLNVNQSRAARTAFERALAIRPGEGRYLYNHALASEQLGDGTRSEEALFRAAHTHPPYKPAVERLAKLCEKESKKRSPVCRRN